MNALMSIITNTGTMLLHPRRAGQVHAVSPDLRSAGWLVIGFGLWYGGMFYLSHLARDYPPGPEVLAVWVAAWGEFAMLPFIAIPAESYRLFLAFASLPLALAAWMLMGSTAYLLSRLLSGQVRYESFLCLTAFAFFPIWILTALLDMAYNALLGAYIIPALTRQYGTLAYAFYQNFPVLEYTLLFGLAGVLIAVASWSAERAASGHPSAWKAALIGWAAFAWPTLLVAVLVR
jgi:hypothetical protein